MKTLIFEMSLERNTTLRREQRLRKLGQTVDKGKKAATYKALLDLIHAQSESLIFHHFLPLIKALEALNIQSLTDKDIKAEKQKQCS
jgi:hypothetical protein